MSISAVNGASPQQEAVSGVTSIPPATSFTQELDAQTTKATTHGHHHGGASQSVTSSAATAASAAGVGLPGATAASLHQLLSSGR
jgi:hypothetical protein